MNVFNHLPDPSQTLKFPSGVRKKHLCGTLGTCSVQQLPQRLLTSVARFGNLFPKLRTAFTVSGTSRISVDAPEEYISRVQSKGIFIQIFCLRGTAG